MLYPTRELSNGVLQERLENYITSLCVNKLQKVLNSIVPGKVGPLLFVKSIFL